MSRPTCATISRSALTHNVGVVRELAPRARVMAVVKANAYGHGAIEVARCLEPAVDALAVACLEEALELRAAGIEKPLLLLEGTFSHDELTAAAEKSLWVTVENASQLNVLLGADLPHRVTCWIKVDTGMHRLGFTPSDVLDTYNALRLSENVADDIVVFTHFEDAETNNSATNREQLAQFQSIAVSAPRSACNSAGILTLPEAHFDWVRPGYMLYGNSPLPQASEATRKLRPAMTLTTQVSSLRDISVGQSVGYGGAWVAQRPTTIATLPIGYGDGYPRGTPAGTPVLINQHSALLAGRVSMDMITVDVTDLDAISIGDSATL